MNDHEFLKRLQEIFLGIELELDEVVIFLKSIGLMNPQGGPSIRNGRKRLTKSSTFQVMLLGL